MNYSIFQNRLHPRAIYIDDDAWLSGRFAVQNLPSADECKNLGADRFRIILPETAAPPDGWQLEKKDTNTQCTSFKDSPHPAKEPSILSIYPKEWQGLDTLDQRALEGVQRQSQR